MSSLTLYILKKIGSVNNTYTGNIKIVSPIELRIGSTVLTPDGIGIVTSFVENFGSKPIKAEVLLYRKYKKLYYIIHLQQYVIFHKFSNQFIRISPPDYRYIYNEDQEVEYRLTTRKYARLTEKSKNQYEYVKALSKTRYGLKSLRLISKYGIIIKKR